MHIKDSLKLNLDKLNKKETVNKDDSKINLNQKIESLRI